MKLFFQFLSSAIKKWWSRPKDIAPLTKRYLLKELTKQGFLILGQCLERQKLDYKDLFWFCEDISVHSQMELCAEDKGFSSIVEAFTKKEIAVILSAESLLNSAPISVHEELRVFCHV